LKAVIYQFGDCSLDTGGLELKRSGDLVALEPQVFRLIVCLIENRGRVVSKDELIDIVWDGRIVSDGALNTRINSARNALGDSGKIQAVIKTFPRQGFRFVADVVEVEPVEAVPGATPLPLPDKPSIAVLAFENISGDPEQEYFADGLAEDIITGLSKFHWFFVIARNSSFTYKGSAVDVKQVAAELGVQYVMEGSVRKAGNRVRITAQLIDAPTGRHIWAERYDRDLEDIFAVQDEITQAIVGEVAPSFISAEARRVERKAPESFDAWDYCMRGNWYLSHRGKDDIAEARRLFEAALEQDPNSTMALNGLAVTLGWMINFGWAEDQDEARSAAHAAARRAVELDDNDAEAHIALGLISFYMDQVDAAVAASRRAIELNPNLAAAEAWLGMFLSWAGDYNDAIAHARMAQRLSPRDSFSIGNFARTTAEYGAGHYEQSVEWAKKMIEVTPEFPAAWLYLTFSLAHLDRLEEARAAKDQILRLMPHFTLRFLRAAMPSGRPEEIDRRIDGLRKAGLPE
jgi:TolB-like protein/Flp pilus assembly protein TadD